MSILNDLFGSASAPPGEIGMVQGNAPQTGGETFGERLMNPLSQVGLALLANHGTPKSQRGMFEGVPQAVAGATAYQQAKKKEAKAEEQRNQTLAWLQQTDPEVASLVNAGMDVGDAYTLSLKRKQLAQGPEPTSEMRNFQFAQANPGFAKMLGMGQTKAPNIENYYNEDGLLTQGYYDPEAGGMVQVGGAKPAAVADDGFKAPSGFMRDPDDPSRLKPIPGGPGEQISAEVAGRIGIANSFLKNLPDIRKRVQDGQVTGMVDATLGRTGYGNAGQVYSDIESGVDALQRMLTGAGQNQSEAEAYARRYAPKVTDDVDTLNYKLDRLQTELNAQMDIVLRGRGGIAPPVASGGGNSYKDKYGLE